jgi:serine/threonine protein kinase
MPFMAHAESPQPHDELSGPAAVVPGQRSPSTAPTSDTHATGDSLSQRSVDFGLEADRFGTGFDPPIGVDLGGIRIERLIGEGGMGAVYEARQERPDRRVALKILRSPLATPGQIARFEFESQILARLKHPGIAQVFESGMHRDAAGTTPWFAMELIESAEPITRWAARRKGESGWSKETLQGAISRFLDVCDAVQHGHQQGIIHRDLKPANILIDAASRVRVIDFGIAKMIDTDDAPTRALTSSITGTLAYMAPEVFARGIEASAAPDTRGDIYSLGVVLYELLVGRVPLDVAKLPLFEATEQIAHAQPVRPGTLDSFVNGDLDAVVLKSLAKDPAQRYQSLADFAKDLRRYLAGEAVDARPPTLRYQLRVFARRHRTLVSTGGLIAATLLVATGVSVRFAMIANQRATEARLQDRGEREHRRVPGQHEPSPGDGSWASAAMSTSPAPSYGS